MSVSVLGAGAFGTALAIALAQKGPGVTLWARDPAQARLMAETGTNRLRLPGHRLPSDLQVTADIARAARADTCLLAMPMQALAGFLAANARVLHHKRLVACCKGVDLATGVGPTGVIEAARIAAIPAVLSGPSFAVDIAAGLPTALTIAAGPDIAASLQADLSSPVLRLYRSTDPVGVELGGALKNVIAIACGITIGAGLGESARAALMTRGYAEMKRFAVASGARPETLSGLSGLGDLALTCGSKKSRNFSFGLRLGAEGRAGATATTEGIATARAASLSSQKIGVDMPITMTMAQVLAGDLSVRDAVGALLARPLKPE